MSFKPTKLNSGVAFPRDKKTDNSPDMGGVVNIGGKDHWMSVWGEIDDYNLRISLNPMGSEGFDDSMDGELFEAEKKNERSPAYKGSIADGSELVVWVQTCGPKTKNPGTRFLSVKVNTTTRGSQSIPAKPPVDNSNPQANLSDGDDGFDDIPF